MLHDRFRACVAVYGVLFRHDDVLLIRRAGSGYRDGQLSLPGGHLDGDEDAVHGLCRELYEELAIAVQPQHCELRTVLHRPREHPTADEYIDLFFSVAAWIGTPSIAEPTKCTELLWSSIDHLPGDIIDYVAVALDAIEQERPLILFGWPQSDASPIDLKSKIA